MGSLGSRLGEAMTGIVRYAFVVGFMGGLAPVLGACDGTLWSCPPVPAEPPQGDFEMAEVDYYDADGSGVYTDIPVAHLGGTVTVTGNQVVFSYLGGADRITVTYE